MRIIAPALIILLCLFFVLQPHLVDAAVHPDGSLLKAINGHHIYLIEHGKKRWVTSEEAFNSHKFSWENLQTVSPHELDLYSMGEPVESNSSISVPLESDLLPDLAPLAMRDLHIATVNNQQALRFTSLFWNQGSGPLELRMESVPNSDELSAIQRIYQSNGDLRETTTGKIVFHNQHGHYHFDNFSSYELTPLQVETSSQVESQTNKASFCMRDDVRISNTIDNVQNSATYTDCNGSTQGVSVGWADRYAYTLEDQHVFITGLPAGVYRLDFKINAAGLLHEETQVNNVSSLLIELNPSARRVNVLARLAPYKNSPNEVNNGLLLRGENTSRVYVIQNNKKRWLMNEEVFLSYDYNWGDVFEVPQSIIDSIPSEHFVQTPDNHILMLNDHGYVRRILNPAVHASYNPSSTPRINAAELTHYQETKLVRKQNDERVYSIQIKAQVGLREELAQKNVSQLAVQNINDTDFRSYAVSTVQENLTIPWDIAFLPNGDMLVTERPGTLRRFGETNASIDLPDVLHSGEGGLMGIAVHPEFKSNNYIYLYFTTDAGSSNNKIVRYKLEGSNLIEDKTILENIPGAVYHDGGQIAFGPDEMLYITTGDASQPSLAQDLNSLAGKTLRLTDEGEVPTDNPLGTAVWSYGHRNAQGLAWNEEGQLWATEHGRSGSASGYDELNLIQKSGNYGWPHIQGGIQSPKMFTPVLHSGANDTWAPSGLAHHNGWLYWSGLRGSRLYAAHINGQSVDQIQEHFINEFGRLRASTIGPDEHLYISTSNRDGRGNVRSGDDRIIKIAPGMLEAL